MAHFEIIMPKLGESIQEATITKWFVKEGDTVSEDDLLFEVATDKVDSEIPSPVDGKIIKIFHPENSVLPVGEKLALIALSDDESQPETSEILPGKKMEIGEGNAKNDTFSATATRFYSPLVRQIAAKENISIAELESIKGTGSGGRVQKKDIVSYLEGRQTTVSRQVIEPVKIASGPRPPVSTGKVSVSPGANDQIIEMDRVRKLIAEHMVMSKQVSPHVTSVVEADVTNLVRWREKVKDDYLSRYGEKLTYMPVFIEATARALAEFPWVNSSVDGDRIILRRNVNIGVAVAKPDGNLIVPVIKGASEMNLLGITRGLNKLANAARNNKLAPEDIQDGTFTITNFGSFRNLIGTPIINQPQAAILATGSIEKKPAVVELPTGDAIAIRHKMFLSLSYDHRVIDGALGGAFLRRIADLLEEFDINRSI